MILKRLLKISKQKNHVVINNETVYYYSHVTDHLKGIVEKVNKENNNNFRIVIFIDDLDRCLPENALAILESIKIFFDIIGLIFVIGMDPQSIDFIIKTKYGENPTIKGDDYLQKIVQLPFYLPKWTEDDIIKFIKNSIVKELNHSYLENDFNNEEIISLIRLSIGNNPRQIKRFVNTIILIRICIWRRQGY